MTVLQVGPNRPRITTKGAAAYMAAALLVLLCTNPSWTQGHNHINLLLCSAMCLTPLVLLMKGCRVIIPRIDLPLCLVIFFVLAWPVLFHPESIRLSTMLFTCAYCVTMMAFVRLLRVARPSAGKVMALIKWIVYAYAACLVIQQICRLLGLPIFNDSMHDFFDPWKLNSLNTEASHSSLTMVALMWTYYQTMLAEHPSTRFLSMLRADWLLNLCWLWVSFTTNTASGMMLVPLVIIPWIRRKDLWKWAVAIGVFSIFFFNYIDKQGGNPARVSMAIRDTLGRDYDMMIYRVPTAAYRILPSFYGAEAMIPPSSAWLTGHGIDADKFETPPRPARPIRPDMQYASGCAGFFTMAYNYGLPCAIALWWAVGAFTLVRRRPSTWLFFLTALFFSAEYNMQIFWMIMACGCVYKYGLKDSPCKLRSIRLSKCSLRNNARS